MQDISPEVVVAAYNNCGSINETASLLNTTERSVLALLNVAAYNHRRATIEAAADEYDPDDEAELDLDEEDDEEDDCLDDLDD